MAKTKTVQKRIKNKKAVTITINQNIYNIILCFNIYNILFLCNN